MGEPLPGLSLPYLTARGCVPAVQSGDTDFTIVTGSLFSLSLSLLIIRIGSSKPEHTYSMDNCYCLHLFIIYCI